jgi:hypothetical protein
LDPVESEFEAEKSGDGNKISGDDDSKIVPHDFCLIGNG